MPPTNHVQLVEPGYDESVDSYATESRTSYRFFKPEYGDKAAFYKPKYDKKRKPLTVFRPFPCASFTKPGVEFEPYRKDPGGRNFLGWWLKRLYVAWNVGNPAISFIVHDPRTGPYDGRITPLGVLNRAVRYAVKKGQGKADNWQAFVRPQHVEPGDKALLKWTGMLDGAQGKGAALDGAKELYLMQGMLLVDDSQKTYLDGKAPIGWGSNPTCVFGLTQGAGAELMKLINTEVENFRGDPANFEARYVNGDPVGPMSGRFIYVYPKGGDPRQPRYQSDPTEVDPTEFTGGGRDGEKKKEEVGFSCHLEKNYERIPAAMSRPQQMQEMHSHWIHWDDVRDTEGRVVKHGLLHYPTYAEQAQILGRVFPADMLEYAFYGEHSDWLTEDILRKARAARTASVPAAPPTSSAAAYTPPAPSTPFFDDGSGFAGYDDPTAPPAAQAEPPGLIDPAVAEATGGVEIEGEVSDLADGMDILATAAGTGFDPLPAPTGAPVPVPSAAPPAAEAPASAGKLAAARAALAAAKAGQKPPTAS